MTLTSHVLRLSLARAAFSSARALTDSGIRIRGAVVRVQPGGVDQGSDHSALPKTSMSTLPWACPCSM